MVSGKGAVLASDSIEQQIFQDGRKLHSRRGLEQLACDGKKATITRDGRTEKIRGHISVPVSSFCPGPAKSLEEMLYEIHRHMPDATQYGFVDKQGACIAYSFDVELDKPPNQLTVRNRLCAEKRNVNSVFFKRIRANLSSISITETEKSMFKRTWTKSRALDELKISLEHLSDYRHGLIQRYMYKHRLSFKPYNLQKAMDEELLPRHVRSKIVVVRGMNYTNRAHELAYKMQRQTGCMAFPMVNFPLIALRGSCNDIKKLHKRALGGKLYTCHGIYTPEMIAGFAKGNHYTIQFPKRNREILWNLHNIGSENANQVTKGSGVDVAVVDSGVDSLHAQLRARFGQVQGYDFIENSPHLKDPNGHGTHVAGTIAGMSTGVAPACTLFALRVLNARGAGTLDNVLRGVDWCISHGIRLANFSLGASIGNYIEEEVYRKAMQAGVICIAAAGNDGYGPNYPAAYDSTIAVAAVDRFNRHARFSNIYFTNNVSAPGVGIYSTLPGNDFGVLSGTSMATPHVTGVGALAASLNSLDKAGYVKLLESTSAELGHPADKDNRAKYGCGLVQAQNAVKYQANMVGKQNGILGLFRKRA